MLVLFLGILAQTKEKQCEGKDLRSANGLAGCTSLNFQFDPLSAAEITAVAKAVSGGEIAVLICRGCELGAAGMDVLGPALLSQDSISFITLREDALGAPVDERLADDRGADIYDPAAWELRNLVPLGRQVQVHCLVQC